MLATRAHSSSQHLAPVKVMDTQVFANQAPLYASGPQQTQQKQQHTKATSGSSIHGMECTTTEHGVHDNRGGLGRRALVAVVVVAGMQQAKPTRPPDTESPPRDNNKDASPKQGCHTP